MLCVIEENIMLFDDGIKNLIVTGAFHDWFDKKQMQRIARFYGISWIELVDYAVDELGYDSGNENIDTFFTNTFGDRDEYYS
jgi:hypothetical protein